MAVSAGAIKAGSAYVDIGADPTKLKAGLKAAGASMLAFSAVVVGAITVATKVFTSMGDEIDKASRRTGLSAEAISSLGRAAERSGASLATVEVAVRGMNRTIYNAARGSADAVDALDALGISATQFEGLSVEERFSLVADALAGVADMSQRSALAMAVFGRAGTQLLPMLEDGAAGLAKFRREAEAMGLIMSKEDAAAAAVLTDAFGDLGDSMNMNLAQLGAALAPMIKGLVGVIMDMSVWVTKWFKANKTLVGSIGKVVAIAAVLAAVVGTALLVIPLLAGAVVALSISLGVLGVAFAWLLANPLVLVFAGLAALVVGAAIAIGTLTGRTNEYTTAARDALALGDKQRAADQARMRRLETLAEKERLNAKEMADAAAIIATLEGRYGTLGITIDETTGQIDGLTRGMGRFTNQMAEMRKMELKIAIVELRDEVRKLTADLEKTTEYKLFDMFRAGGDEAAATDMVKRMNAAIKEIHAAQRELVGLEAGDLEAGGITPKPGAPVAGSADAEGESAESLADLKKELTAELLADRLSAIDDAHERELAAIGAEWVARAATIDRESADGQAMLKKLGAIMAARYRQEARDNARKVKAAKKAESDAKTAADKRRADAKADANTDRDAANDRLEIKTDYAERIAKARAAGKDTKGLEKKRDLALLAEERKQAIAAAGGDAELIADLEKKFDLKKRKLIADAVTIPPTDTPAAGTGAAKGTFSAFEAARFGGGTAAERTANATELTASNTKSLRNASGSVFA